MQNIPRAATILKRSGFFLLLPLLMSCEDSLDDLYPKVQPVQVPAATQAGLNTFGCRVNGQVWEANNASTLDGKVITPTARYSRGELRLDAFRRLQVTGPVNNFHFRLGRVTRPGVYELGVAEAGNFAEVKTATGMMDYVTDGRQAGTLTITRLDTTGAQAFVAGRFELRAAPRHGARRSAELPAELQVTEGRFDIQLSR